MKLVENILFGLSRRVMNRRRAARHEDAERIASDEAYQAWRKSELSGQLNDNFPREQLQGKDVLDFGCGGGSLALMVAELGARSVLGVDLDEKGIRTAQQRLETAGTDNVTFLPADDPRRINADDESLDVICCFDVVEHITTPDEIAAEWRRILRPGGQVWIWWFPWRHPYGHHMTSLIPLPWVHLLTSEKTLIRVAARIYDDDCFPPPVWNRDPETGQKKPNEWRTGKNLSSRLNKMTLRQFKNVCRRANLDVSVRGHGFGHSGVKKLIGMTAWGV